MSSFKRYPLTWGIFWVIIATFLVAVVWDANFSSGSTSIEELERHADLWKNWILVFVVEAFLGFVAVVIDQQRYKDKLEKQKIMAHTENTLLLGQEKDFHIARQHVSADDRTSIAVDVENKTVRLMNTDGTGRVQRLHFADLGRTFLTEHRQHIRLQIWIRNSLDDPFLVSFYEMPEVEYVRASVNRGHHGHHFHYDRCSKEDKQKYAAALQEARNWDRFLTFYIEHPDPNDPTQPYSGSHSSGPRPLFQASHQPQPKPQRTPHKQDQEPAAAAEPATGSSVADLVKLAELFEKGYITKEEFELQKAHIIQAAREGGI